MSVLVLLLMLVSGVLVGGGNGGSGGAGIGVGVGGAGAGGAGIGVGASVGVVGVCGVGGYGDGHGFFGAGVIRGGGGVAVGIGTYSHEAISSCVYTAAVNDCCDGPAEPLSSTMPSAEHLDFQHSCALTNYHEGPPHTKKQAFLRVMIRPGKSSRVKSGRARKHLKYHGSGRGGWVRRYSILTGPFSRVRSDPRGLTWPEKPC